MVKLIIEQLCFGVVINKSSLKSANKMALISIDDAAMTAISNYIKTNNLSEINDTDKPINNSELFLEIIVTQHKITNFEMEDIKKFHNLKKNLLQQSDIIISDVVNKYVVLVKILLAYLYDYRATKSEWEGMIEDYRKKLKL